MLVRKEVKDHKGILVLLAHKVQLVQPVLRVSPSNNKMRRAPTCGDRTRDPPRLRPGPLPLS